MFSISGTSRSSICSSTTSGMVPSFSRPSARGPALGGLGLQVSVHEVDLLEPAKALADVLRPDLTDALDLLQLGVGRRKHLVQPPELAHDLLDHQLRQARDAPQDAVAPGRDGVVERVDLAVVAQKLRQAPEVEQVLVGQAGKLVQYHGVRL